jgi:hypothetical protein
MKILYLNTWNHPKNHEALLYYKNIELISINTIQQFQNINLSQFDAVYSPSQPINVSLYPNTKFIFGPHFSIFPDKNQIDLISRPNSTYIQPSEWASNVWINDEICKNIKIKSLPFAVNTYKFNENKPILERNQVFIYYKGRNMQDLSLIEQFFKNKNINYKIFSYKNKYNENDFINYLQNSKYGIWIGCNESQGFALEEALSCNVPLLVWNIKFISKNNKDISATSIPYWDERCGEYFYNINELENIFNLFISKLNTYKPREYILENLTSNLCEQKLINIINN